MHHKVAFALAASLGICIAKAGERDCPSWKGLVAADISIPAQPLSQALQALAAQTGVDILFEPATVAGLRSVPVRGRMNPGEALCLLLEDPGLVYSINSERTAIISKRERRASNVDDVPQVMVTGTRRSDRAIVDSPVPISGIRGESLSQFGSTNTNAALAALVPSFSFPRPSLTDATDIIRPATLRGLGPDQMLVLVNGKRRHVSALLNINSSVGRGTAAVDLGRLPIAAIDRIEVLRDGAAAQYGSDAIAGVVNVLLKERREGAEVSVTYGQRDTRVDGVQQAAGVVTQPNGQPVVLPDGVYDLRDGGDRKAHDGKSLTLAGNFGLALGPGGFLDIAVQGVDQHSTNRAGYDPRAQFLPSAPGMADSRELSFDRLTHRFGEPKLRSADVTLNAGVPFANGEAEWYTFGTFGAEEGHTQGFYRMASDRRTVTSLFPNGFLAQLDVDVEDNSLATGLRGVWQKWNYDASVHYGRNAIDFTTEHSNNASLGSASPTEFDSGGLRYRESLAHFGAQRDFDIAAFDAPSSVAWGLEHRAERFAIRAGEPASYEQGPVVLPDGRPAAAGAQVFPGFRPDNATDHMRRSTSAYLDVEQDLSARWTLALAGRAEDYSDFGSTVNYKLASRFRLTESLAVRGAIATGFRAPSLHQQFFSATSTNDVGGRLADVGTFAVTNGVARALGARDLQPERSTNLGAGVTFSTAEGFGFSADLYRIEIRDRIVLTENLGTSGTSEQNAAVQGVLAAAGYESLGGARFFINGMDTRTQGLDLDARYRLSFAQVGSVQLSAGYNHTKTEITRLINDLHPLAQIPGLVLFGRLESERIERGQPRSKLYVSAEWQRSNLAATLRANRYGEVFAPAANWRDDYVIEPAWVADLELRYASSGIELALGSENLFDRYPTRAPTGARPAQLGGNYNVNNYILPFSGFSAFGFAGRYVYGRVTRRF